uniref:Ribosomal protein S12 n=1 Tax=Romanomermis culicivorax TaxID=13658 RepID=A0A915IJH7_ROMCU
MPTIDRKTSVERQRRSTKSIA